MFFSQRLFLIMSVALFASQSEALTAADINCGNTSSNLARNVAELTRLTSRANVSSYTPRAPASSSASMDAADSGEYADGTQKGLGAIFSWFDRNVGKSKGLCTLGVRGALQAGGWWPCGQGMGMSPSKDIGPNLIRNGFKKIPLTKSSLAKPGTVLIYKSICSSRVDKNARYGHIEMRTNKGYASDFFKATPIDSYNPCRKLQAAYVKTTPPGRSCNQSLSSLIANRRR